MNKVWIPADEDKAVEKILHRLREKDRGVPSDHDFYLEQCSSPDETLLQSGDYYEEEEASKKEGHMSVNTRLLIYYKS